MKRNRVPGSVTPISQPRAAPLPLLTGQSCWWGQGLWGKALSPLNSSSSGYAVEVTSRNRVQNLFLGAPRYQHIGLVVIFRQNAGVWQKSTEIKGSQVSAECVGHRCTNRSTLGTEGFQDGHHQVPMGQSFVFFFFKLFILYWSIADYQYCDSFRWTAKGLSHTYKVWQRFVKQIPEDFKLESSGTNFGTNLHLRISCPHFSDNSKYQHLTCPELSTSLSVHKTGIWPVHNQDELPWWFRW